MRLAVLLAAARREERGGRGRGEGGGPSSIAMHILSKSRVTIGARITGPPVARDVSVDREASNIAQACKRTSKI